MYALFQRDRYLSGFAMKNASFAGGRPHQPRTELPAGVCHVSQVMPLVLARYGLSMDEQPDADCVAPASEATDFFDVTIAALESVLAG
jgi:hypothetical protein